MQGEGERGRNRGGEAAGGGLRFFSPWTCASYRAGTGPSRSIVEWEVYRGVRGLKFASPSEASQSAPHPPAGYNIYFSSVAAPVGERGKDRIGLSVMQF